MKVLTVGAAGTSAGLVVQALHQRGVEVRGLAHSAGREEAARENGASEVVVADLTDREALRRAIDGVDAVFHVIPAFAPDEAAIGVGLVEVAAALTGLLDRPVRAEDTVQSLPDTMTAAMRDGLMHMFEHYDRYGFRGGNDLVLATLLGRAPTTVPEYLEQAVRSSE